MRTKRIKPPIGIRAKVGEKPFHIAFMLDQFFITVNSDWPTHSKEPRTPSFCECRAIQKDRFISQRR